MDKQVDVLNVVLDIFYMNNNVLNKSVDVKHTIEQQITIIVHDAKQISS